MWNSSLPWGSCNLKYVFSSAEQRIRNYCSRSLVTQPCHVRHFLFQEQFLWWSEVEYFTFGFHLIETWRYFEYPATVYAWVLPWSGDLAFRRTRKLTVNPRAHSSIHWSLSFSQTSCLMDRLKENLFSRYSHIKFFRRSHFSWSPLIIVGKSVLLRTFR